MKRILAITAVLVLAVGLAAWSFPTIVVTAPGHGNVEMLESLFTSEGSAMETIMIDGKFGLHKSLELWPPVFGGGFIEHETLGLKGSLYYEEILSTVQGTGQLNTVAHIEATGCFKLVKYANVGGFPGQCGCIPAYNFLVLTLAVKGLLNAPFGYVEEGTFTLGHSATTTTAQIGPHALHPV